MKHYTSQRRTRKKRSARAERIWLRRRLDAERQLPMFDQAGMDLFMDLMPGLPAPTRPIQESAASHKPMADAESDIAALDEMRDQEMEAA